ncbi:MAG: IclR family transcriptional regulator [Actinomycetota bacterium]|nr:IclR family transcriptional regulator [Actinomycetota bacterium]
MLQSIERAMSVLTIISDGPATPSDVARRLDVHRSTTLRVMNALASQRLLRKLPDGRYGIGPGLITLANNALDQFRLNRIAHPRLGSLSELFDQTVHLAELHPDQVVYVDKIEPRRSIRLASRIGDAVPLHTASVAKAILAFQPAEERSRLLDGHEFTPFTDRTLTSAADLEVELAMVRERGWAVDDGELEGYVNCIGVPIRDSSGGVVAAISITDLKAINDLPALEEKVLQPLTETARAISFDLGWQEPTQSSHSPEEAPA